MKHPTIRRGPKPRHTYLGQPMSVEALAALAGVAGRTMVRRLLVLKPEEAVALGQGDEGVGSRQVNAESVPVRAYSFDGRPHSIVDLAALAGCSVDAMRCRLDYGRTPEEAVADGARAQPGRITRYRLDGQPTTAAALARQAGCSLNAMQLRLHRGRTPEEAIAMGGPRSSRR